MAVKKSFNDWIFFPGRERPAQWRMRTHAWCGKAAELSRDSPGWARGGRAAEDLHRSSRQITTHSHRSQEMRHVCVSMCCFVIYLAAAKASQSERWINRKTAAYTLHLSQCHGNRGHVGHGLITLAIQYHNFNYTLSHGAGLCTGFSPLATEFPIEPKINK